MLEATKVVETLMKSLLMPERKVRSFAKEKMSTIEMADHFDVSLSAMSWRLQHLGIK